MENRRSGQLAKSSMEFPQVVSAIQQQVTSLQLSNASKYQEIVNLRKEEKRLNHKIKDLEAQVRQFRVEKAIHQTQVDQQLRAEALKAQVAKLEVEKENVVLKRLKNELLSKISLLENGTAVLEKEVADLKEKLEDMHNSTANAQAQLQAAQIGFDQINASFCSTDNDIGQQISTLGNAESQAAAIGKFSGRLKSGRELQGMNASPGVGTSAQTTEQTFRRAKKRPAPAPIIVHEKDESRVVDGFIFCKCNSKPFRTELALQRHIRYHLTDRRLECYLCHAEFTYFYSFKNHVIKKHKKVLDMDDKRTACVICVEEFKTREEFIIHYKEEHYPEETPESGVDYRAHPAEIFLVRY
ncbi:unnamed protein product [Orchesella dallaii]|uniref:C2H2-type domain-containing protein n=1 Tax=Orchesella dallaii TaxID=48710 RepID=A0ABP1QDU8_9HEXA